MRSGCVDTVSLPGFCKGDRASAFTRHNALSPINHAPRKYFENSLRRIILMNGPHPPAIAAAYEKAATDCGLCPGQPVSSNPKSETGLLQVRLVVASIGAVIIGFLSASTPETNGRKTPPEVTGNAVPILHLPASSNLKSVARLVPDPILGFAVIVVAPAAQRVPLPAATVAEMISLARPMIETLDQAEIDALEVTPPARKPKIKVKVKSKRPLKPKPELTFWQQLPLLR